MELEDYYSAAVELGDTEIDQQLDLYCVQMIDGNLEPYFLFDHPSSYFSEEFAVGIPWR